MKKTIKITIERSNDMYSAYADKVEGAYGGGDTVEEAKASIERSIGLLKQYNKKETLPNILKGDFDLVYHFDV